MPENNQELLKLIARYVAPLENKVDRLERELRRQKTEIQNLRAQLQRFKR